MFRRLQECKRAAGETVLPQHAGTDLELQGGGKKRDTYPSGGGGTADRACTLEGTCWRNDTFHKGTEPDTGGGALPGGRRRGGTLPGNPDLH